MWPQNEESQNGLFLSSNRVFQKYNNELFCVSFCALYFQVTQGRLYYVQDNQGVKSYDLYFCTRIHFWIEANGSAQYFTLRRHFWKSILYYLIVSLLG